MSDFTIIEDGMGYWERYWVPGPMKTQYTGGIFGSHISVPTTIEQVRFVPGVYNKYEVNKEDLIEKDGKTYWNHPIKGLTELKVLTEADYFKPSEDFIKSFKEQNNEELI